MGRAATVRISRPVVAEDVRDLQSWTGHVDPLRWRLVLFLRHQWGEPVQRAPDLTDDAGGHMGVARRGVELGMSEQPRGIMRSFYVIET
jgi:hypothetical protein